MIDGGVAGTERAEAVMSARQWLLAAAEAAAGEAGSAMTVVIGSP